MHVGIKTFSDANNYGAMVQSYALKAAVEKEGYTVKVLKNETDTISKRYVLKYNTDSIKSLISSSIRNFYLKRRYKKFEQFRQHRLNISTYDKTFDIVIAGSDQIWNPDISLSDSSYFLDFVYENVGKIAYAPSFGKTSIDGKYYTYLKENISRFDEISVREKEGQAIINQIFDKNKNVLVVLDPTFLLTKEDWVHNLNLSQSIPGKKYILCYMFDFDKETKEFVNKLAKIYECRIVCISDSISMNHTGYHYERTADPKEWLELILNASFVVTNSFHGMAMSIIFNKQFFVGKIHKQESRSRIDNLLRVTGIEKRFIGLNSYCPINYSKVNAKLANEIAVSKRYLERSLRKVMELNNK